MQRIRVIKQYIVQDRKTGVELLYTDLDAAREYYLKRLDELPDSKEDDLIIYSRQVTETGDEE